MPLYIKPYTNWLDSKAAYEYFLPFSQDSKGKWNNLQLTEDEQQTDYFFVINHPGAQIVPSLKRTLVFQMEPQVGINQWGSWAAPPRADFFQVRSHDLYLNNCEWHLGLTHQELAVAAPLEKTRVISAVISDKYIDPGHIKRVNFLRFIETKDSKLISIFGTCASLQFTNYKGILPHMNKANALLPYTYHFAAENHSEHNYITEKVCDAILANCLCFYFGAPNIEEVFPDAVIPLALEDFPRDYEVILATISRGEHERRLPAIRRAREKILYQYSIFPTLDAVITTHSKCRRTYCLNLARRTDRREKMVQKLKAAGLQADFRLATDGRDDSVFTPEIIRLFKGNDFNYKRGTMACALSHLAMWLELVADETAADDDYYFILEDDVEFEDTFTRYFEYVVHSLDPNWSMLFLGYQMFEENLSAHHSIYRKTQPAQEPIVAPLNLDLYIGGFHCYLITKVAARKLCDFISLANLRHGIDYIPKRYGCQIGLSLYESQYQLAAADWVYSWGRGDSDVQVNSDELPAREIYKALYPWEEVVNLLLK